MAVKLSSLFGIPLAVSRDVSVRAGVEPWWFLFPLSSLSLFTQAWKPSSQHAGEKRGVAGLLLGRTERAARAAELQLCAQAR